MRNRLWTLYRTLLSDHYGLSAAKFYYLKKRQRTWEPVVIALAMASLGAGVVRFIWSLTESLFVAGLAFGQPHLALLNGALLVSMAGLFFGFFSVLSAFFFSRDLEVLVPLPLRPWEILLAKFGVVLTGQYLLNLLILLPLWLRYGQLAGVGLGYVVSALVVFFALPLLPLTVASVLTLVFMRFVNISRHRDKLTLIGGLLLLAATMGFQFWLQSTLGAGDPEVLMEQLLSQADGLIKAAGRVFPPSVWAAQAMAYSHTLRGWLNLCYLAASSIAALFVLFLLGERVFLRGLLAGFEGSKGGGKARRVRLVERSRSPLVTLAVMEGKLFVRDPGFALNGLVGYVLWPVLFVLPLFGQKVQNNPFEFLALDQLPSLAIAGGIALYFVVAGAMSLIPSTTFSREGKHLWLIRTLPLTIEQIIAAKVLGAVLVNTVGCLVGVVPVAFLMGWGPWEVVLGSVLGTLLAGALSGLLILVDLRRPMLDWVNPIKAVKSNVNAVLGMLVGAGLVFALGALIYFNMRTATLWLVPLELLGTALLLGGVVTALVKRWAPILWARL